MPGIVGIIPQKPLPGSQDHAITMLSSMMHEPFYISGTHCVPEMGIYTGWVAHENSFAADQVFSNETGDITLIVAGECFADPEVRSWLKRAGHILKSHNDWLVHFYEEEGEQFFEKLNGLFSGLLIDKRKRKAFLFNDRYGVERIYCHSTRDATYFASEAKALLRILPELRAFDEEGVAQFLTYGCTLEERTLFKGIQLLPGGSLWSFESGRSCKKRYFSPEAWESQSPLPESEFQSNFDETLKKVLSRYFESEARIGISLTGGLDTRMIMACRPPTVRQPLCYTFSGKKGKTYDDKLAERVAKVCGLEHHLLRVNFDFFSDFARHVDRTVYVTDGCFGLTGAHEIYLNRRARQLTPVRLTGNYGSEILRGVSTFGQVGLSPALFNPQFTHTLNSALHWGIKGSEHPITFAAFHEVPGNLFGSLAASRSQVSFRTPYLDNELVALAYQVPKKLRGSPLPAWGVVQANSPELSKIPTDKGQLPNNPGSAVLFRRFFSEATFKLDYLNNEGWPDWLSPLDSIFTQVTSRLRIVGLHKYLHYRRWFRRELAGYINDAITDARIQQMPFWNPTFLNLLANDHIHGRRNYVGEINAVLTLDAIARLLFRDLGKMTESSASADSISTAAILQ